MKREGAIMNERYLAVVIVFVQDCNSMQCVLCV